MTADEQAVLDYARRSKDQLFRSLARLIQFDSQNFISDGREGECARYLAGVYRQLGLETVLYNPDDLPGFTDHPDYLPGRNTRNRPNVEGIWPGLDQAVSGQAIMLAAHTDTMPAGDRARWHHDPFGGTIADNRIYGLGAGDNKAGLAAAAFAVRVLKDCKIRLNKPVILSAYCDEEYGGATVPWPPVCATGRTRLSTWTAATTSSGRSPRRLHGHHPAAQDRDDRQPGRSVPGAGAPDERAAHVRRQARAELARSEYAGTDMERSAFRLYSIKSPDNSQSDLDVSFVYYTRKIKRDPIGTRSNAAKPRAGLRQYLVETTGFQAATRFFHYGRTDKSNGAAAVLQQAASEAIGHPVAEKGSCLTDLSLFLKYGSPASLNFGIIRDFALPGGAHQPDEFVDCDQFLAYSQALLLFLLRFGGIAGQ
jgi:acetylornithine deacetylase/succinyl-diaminopimelate desuccinylase-like protein